MEKFEEARTQALIGEKRFMHNFRVL